MSPLTKYVLRRLWSRPFVTLLTIGSLAITSFALAGAGATLLGLTHAFADMGSPTRVIVLSKDADGHLTSSLTLEQAARVSTDPGIKRASPVQSFSLMVPSADFSTVDYLGGLGLEEVGFDMYQPRLIKGRMPQKGTPEVLMGSLVLARHPSLDIGSKVAGSKKSHYTIVGVFETGTSHDGEFFATRATITQDDKTNDPSFLLLETASAADAAAVVERLLKTTNLNVKPVVEREYFRSQTASCKPIFYAISIVVLLVVLGAGMGATSALSVTFSQRVGDMAVIRALGFRPRRVVRLLLTEIEGLAIFGACAGVGLAFVAFNHYVAYIVSSGIAIVFRTPLTPMIIGATVSLMVLIGLFSAAVPLVSVMKAEIKDSLRE